MNMDLTGTRGVGSPGRARAVAKAGEAKTALVFWALESPASGGSPSQVPFAWILSKRWLGKGSTRGVVQFGTYHSRPVPSAPQPPDHRPSFPAQELDDLYQDAASNVLLALCQHSWPAVAKHLETEFLTGVFPHRSLLYVMGILFSQGRLCHRMDQETGRRRWPRRVSGTTFYPWL